MSVPPCFTTCVPLSTRAPLATEQRQVRRQVHPTPHARPPTRRVRPSASGDTIPNSPGLLVRSWTDSRSIAATVDLSRRFISVLFISSRCHRAAFAEKQLGKLAEDYAVSRRLLILSAGLDCRPGDLLPFRLISAARSKDIDLSDERPCASFEITDLDYYDFVVVVDRHTRDRILNMAEAHAHTSGGHLYEWERKIRLLCDFSRSMTDTHNSVSVPVDVPKMDDVSGSSYAMDVMRHGCEDIIRSLVAAGM